ncbi:hypothetical protein TELCIR_13862, partial [Teladorsagia circumcincta]
MKLDLLIFRAFSIAVLNDFMGSGGYRKYLKNHMNRFIERLLYAYDVSQQNVRVGIIAVGSGETGSTTVANFKAIDSYGGLFYYLNEMKFQFTDFNHNGQAIEEAFSIAVLNDFMGSGGYRKYLKNHVIVYVTATTKFDDAPQRIVDEILRNGSYGIITVGYGPLVTDKAALQMNSFATSLMSAYDVSQQNARVALIAVGSGQSSTIPVAYFDTIDSYQTLLMYVKFIEEFADFEHDGQAIE